MGSMNQVRFRGKGNFWVKGSTFLSFLNRVHRSRVVQKILLAVRGGMFRQLSVISALGDASDFYIHFDFLLLISSSLFPPRFHSRESRDK